MKVINMFLFLSMFLMMNCSGKTNQSGSTTPNGSERFLKENKTEFTWVHSLKMNDNTFIGDIYVKFINDSIFTDLYVINKSDTLYSIKRHILMSKAGKDVEVLEEGFYGYKFIFKQDDYFVLSNLGNSGANVSDDITIEWNYDRNVLESQKLP